MGGIRWQLDKEKREKGELGLWPSSRESRLQKGRLALTGGSHSQSGQCPGRLEARSEACSALSLKAKQG